MKYLWVAIPDHSEGTPPEESADPSHFKKQHEVDRYFSPNKNEMYDNLTIEDNHTSDYHSDEEQHLLDDADGSEYKMKTGELKSTKHDMKS